MTLALARTQLMVSDLCGSAKPVDKWRVWRAVRDCRISLDLSDRTIQVLRALLTFNPGDILSVDDKRPIVYPSNRTLSVCAGDIPDSTLRRHLGELVKAGLIIRRDSANGKRYARGSGDDRVEFGFDLSPLVVRGPELLALASERRERDLERKALIEQLKVCRRDVTKSLTLLEAFRSPDELDDLRLRYRTQSSRVTQKTTIDELRLRRQQLLAIGRAAIDLIRRDLVVAEMSANESQNERHIQDSKPSKNLTDNEEVDLVDVKTEPLASAQPARQVQFTLASVLEACPEFARFSKSRIVHWGDFLQTAATVRDALAIKRGVWDEAQDALGLQNAGIVLAAILQRAGSGDIRTPGAYLRALTKKASQGKFSPEPMLVALIRERMRTERLRLQAVNLGVSSIAIKRRALE